MNYSIYFPNSCGCNSNQGIYGTNMWNINGNTPGNQYSCGHQQACNGCIDTPKSVCVIYAGQGAVNLVNTGINVNDTLTTILQKLDAIKAIQDTKNTNLLAAINDLNTRVNALETDAGIPGGGSHTPYTLL
jgi:hypothetical protein